MTELVGTKTAPRPAGYFELDRCHSILALVAIRENQSFVPLTRHLKVALMHSRFGPEGTVAKPWSYRYVKTFHLARMWHQTRLVNDPELMEQH